MVKEECVFNNEINESRGRIEMSMRNYVDQLACSLNFLTKGSWSYL
jgi:hypothetical protein